MEQKFDVKRYLDDLENRIDPAIEADLLAQWRRFLTEGDADQVFSPKRNPVARAKIEYPAIMVNDAINDPTFKSMLLGQMLGVNSLISSKAGAVPAIRANYGCNIIPS
ncbi:MAG: hypothetical protein NT118_13415, partial [Lentisphaerae bacterium]|nr:hypothetical protein [Lentisphaerota bacterium]